MIEPLAFATAAGCALLALACLLFATRYRFDRVLPYLVGIEGLPLLAPLVRRPRWWSAVILAVALAVLAIVVVRLQTTWRH